VIERIHTDKAPFVRFADGTEPPLSQAIKVGGLVFTSGQGPLDPTTNEMPANFASFNQVYREFFADNAALPARTTVVTQLVREGVLVEIDAVAALP
jgi:2-iminobutanoate/2-iminopropanoate deaminase